MASLPEIEAAIRTRGANWQAANTPFFDVPFADFNGMFGLSIGIETESLLVEANRGALGFQAPPLPRKMDWRDHRGANWVTPIRFQGATCGSCVSFAVIAAMEVSARLAKSDPSTPIDLSEADLFFCGGRKCAEGWQVPLALNRARDFGVGLESSFPYFPKDQKCKTIEPALRVQNWSVLISRDQRKTALFEDGPIVACLKVFDDFRAYKSGVYEHVLGPQIGLHAVCIVGFDDDVGCWIVKNSWSEQFGENGYFRIKYGECCIDDAFASYRLTVESMSTRSDA